MKYLLLVHLDGSKMAALTPEQSKALDAASQAYDRELERDGHFIAAEALRDPREAVIVRPAGETYATTDGPFAETKEHVGGFILINARDLNEAISLAAKIPVGQFGAVEVRPVMEF